MDNNHNIFVALFCLLSWQESVLSKTLEECEGENLNITAGIYAFIPMNSVDEWCTKLTKTFECLYSDNESKLFIQSQFDSQKFPIEYICQNREEYKKSQTCFLGAGLQDLIKYRCMRRTEIYSCSACASISKCVTGLIKNRQHCTPTDADLMVTLVRLYFHPIRKSNGCTGSSSTNEDDYCPSPIVETTVKTTTAITKTTTTPHHSTTSTTSITSTSTTSITSTSTTSITSSSTASITSTSTNQRSSKSTTTTASSNGNSMARVKSPDNGCQRISAVNAASVFGLVLCSSMFIITRVV